MLAHVLLPLLVFEHGFIQIRFGIFEFFFCFCFISNQYFLILSNFTRYLFSANTIFYWWETFIEQKQSPRGFLWEWCSWKFHKIYRKTPATFLKNRLWHRFFSVNFFEVSKNTFSYRTPLVAASAHTREGWILK